MRVRATLEDGILIRGSAQELRDFAWASEQAAEHGEVEGVLMNPDGLMTVRFVRQEDDGPAV